MVAKAVRAPVQVLESIHRQIIFLLPLMLNAEVIPILRSATEENIFGSSAKKLNLCVVLSIPIKHEHLFKKRGLLVES